MFAVFKRRWADWVNRRIPPTDRQRFEQRNIFILPAGAGVLFGALLLIMLITGINYQNSLIFLLTFMLGAVFVAAMHQTHRNLNGFELTLVRPGEGFAGQSVAFVFRAASPDNDAVAIELSLPHGDLPPQSLDKGETADLTVLVPAPRRGWQGIERLRVETRFPFGLLMAWSWMRPAGRAIVYPRPLTPPQVAAPTVAGEESAQQADPHGHDHAEIRPWREGDLVQRVQWKRYARTGEMVIADWEGEQGSPQWLDYQAFAGADTELRLSYLCAQVLERQQAGHLFGLRLPGQVIEPDQGDVHVRRCLRALALFGLQGPDSTDDRAAPATREAAA
ncbi:MAG: DUF58 domain-containing protein [Marinobacter sp.]|uniref:DUF58 domain-containing protein n=1 Tax=Marinobacter sp. TaxID=50741 RepID=UPI00299E69FF|nr:DUF58 domain-containing protein [Marinobacter sp.]MDX1633146.1 DUF58 domain-containing protein [Marinobacter sp.]